MCVGACLCVDRPGRGNGGREREGDSRLTHTPTPHTHTITTPHITHQSPAAGAAASAESVDLVVSVVKGHSKEAYDVSLNLREHAERVSLEARYLKMAAHRRVGWW